MGTNITKRIFSFLLCLCLGVSGLTTGAQAFGAAGANVIQSAVSVAAEEEFVSAQADDEAPVLESGEEPFALSFEHVNPLYEDLFLTTEPYGVMPLAEAEEVVVPAPEVSFTEDEVDALAAFMRQKALARAADMCFTYISDDYTKTEASNGAAEQLGYDFWAAMYAHTGEPTEGDSLRWQYGTWKLKCLLDTVDGGVQYTFYYHSVKFYTTVEQEEILSAKVNEILASLALAGKTDYEKVCAIYDYVTANVTYNKTSGTSNMLKFTTFGALCNGSAVCQGYALAIYRLCLEVGIDCRLVPGVSNYQNHGWNIVQLGDLYYHVDSTWDAGKSEYVYFLKGSETLSGHTSDEKLGTEKVLGLYSVSPDDFDICDQNGSGAVTAEDLVLLMKYVVGLSVERHISTPDTNGDGVADILDVIHLATVLSEA